MLAARLRPARRRRVPRMVDFLKHLGGHTSLLMRALARTPRVDTRHLWIQVEELGVDAWLIVAITAFFTGSVLALQTSIAFIDFGMGSATIFIPKIVTKSMILELGPVFTALIVAGRSGAGIGAQVASMNVSEQINALRALAVDPITYLVTPRILAMAFVLPLLAVLANFAGIFGGMVYCLTKLGMTANQYTERVLDSILLRDFLTSGFKSMVWGMVIALVGCYQGLTARQGVVGVGTATRETVVHCTIIILISDFFLTRVFRLLLVSWF